jgi:galactokinase
VIDLHKLRFAFISKYGTEPRIFRAPGRVNLIGEHTDYNDGFVLPCAVDFATYVAGAARADRRIRAASLDFANELDCSVDELSPQIARNWTRYVQGVGLTLDRSGCRISGADLLIASDVPVGAGLSSSAALEISTAFALASLSGAEIDGMELAKVGQTAEHEFAGVRTGIMDQFVSVFGEVGHALFLDCRSLEWSPIPVSGVQIIICNTMTKHDLAEGEYNKRRQECEAAARILGHRSLRDVTPAEIEELSVDIPETLRKRARHVVTENMRVLGAVEALRNDDMATFGRLIDESHESLRDDFEVSCYELDVMVELARGQTGVLGARMTGGGFGGCTINLMEPGDHRFFIENMTAAFHRETGILPEIYHCNIGKGVCELGLKESFAKDRDAN